MNIKYSDIAATVKKRKKMTLILGTVFDIIMGIFVCFTGSGYTAVIAAVLFICAVTFAFLLINYLTVDKSLKKMWSKVGSPAPETISSMLGDAEYLFGEDKLMLLTRGLVLNFTTFHAYKLTDMTNIKKTRNHDDDGNVTEYLIKVKCAGGAVKNDSFSFPQEHMRDTAYNKLVSAYHAEGGFGKLTEE